MNSQDRERMDDFRTKLNELTLKIQGISDALLDDERTSREGLISEVEQMRKDLHIIMTAYRVGKWLALAIVAMFFSLLTHTFKDYL